MSRYTKADDRLRLKRAEGLRSLREVVNPDKAASDREQYADARTEIEKMCRDEALAASMERERDER